MTHYYRLYGLTVQTNRALTLLPSQPAATPDLVVNWTCNRSLSPEASLTWDQVLTTELNQRNGITLWRAPSEPGFYIRLRYDTEEAHIDFLLEPDLRTLWIIHSANEPESDLQSYFVGPAMGCVLRLRGTVCLHASVVKIDDRAIAILGKKKSGKSTSAFGLAQLGAAVLSDDMAVLTPTNSGFVVQPGYPQVRLWPRSIAAHYEAVEDLPRVYTSRDKRYLRLGDDEAGGTFWPYSLLLAAIYVLGEINSGDVTPYIEPVAPKNRLMALVENTFGSYVVNQELRHREFEVLAQLSRTVPMRRLMFGHELTTLPAQSRAIIKDLSSQNLAVAAG